MRFRDRTGLLSVRSMKDMTTNRKGSDMKKFIVVGAVITVSLGLGACSNAHSSPPSATITHTTVAALSTTTIPNPSQQVLSIIATGNAAIQAAKAEPDAQAFPAMASALSNAAQQLSVLQYPTNAQADAKALEASLNKLAYDCSEVLKASDIPTITAIEQTIINDEGTEAAASDTLRSDLGLPAATA